MADIEWSEDEGEDVQSNRDEEKAVEVIESSNSTDDESDDGNDSAGLSVVVDEGENNVHRVQHPRGDRPRVRREESGLRLLEKRKRNKRNPSNRTIRLKEYVPGTTNNCCGYWNKNKKKKNEENASCGAYR